jgi:hypothetical protein
MNNWVKLPLSAVPTEWRAVLEECSANFKAQWDGLIAARERATTLGDWKKVEQIDSEISQMMVVNTGEIGDRNIVGKIFGGPNGFAILSEDFLRACS